MIHRRTPCPKPLRPNFSPPLRACQTGSSEARVLKQVRLISRTGQSLAGLTGQNGLNPMPVECTLHPRTPAKGPLSIHRGECRMEDNLAGIPGPEPKLVQRIMDGTVSRRLNNSCPVLGHESLTEGYVEAYTTPPGPAPIAANTKGQKPVARQYLHMASKPRSTRARGS